MMTLSEILKYRWQSWMGKALAQLSSCLVAYINQLLPDEYLAFPLTLDVIQAEKLKVYKSMNACIDGISHIREQDVNEGATTKQCVAASKWLNGSRFDHVEIRKDEEGMYLKWCFINQIITLNII